MVLSGRIAHIGPLDQKRHDTVDLELRQRSLRVSRDVWAIAELCIEVRDSQYWALFGFESLAAYLEDRVGLGYRAVMRYVAAYEAVLELPPEANERAKEALAVVGPSKASIVARALAKDPAHWEDWLEKAQTLTVPALQEEVTSATDGKSRGATAEPGEAFLRYVLRIVPEDTREEVAAVFEAGMVDAETRNAVAVFLNMVRECAHWRRDG